MIITKGEYILREATNEDLTAISELELCCFPYEEAAKLSDFNKRVRAYGNHFLLVFDKSRLIGVVDGPVTNKMDLVDEMYEDVTCHDENGRWQMIFGVETHPDYQHKGIATLALATFIDIARNEGRLGLVLTCKEGLIPFYAKFGFVNEGISVSSHGGAVWYQMRLTFER